MTHHIYTEIRRISVNTNLLKFLAYECESLEYSTCIASDGDNAFWARSIRYVDFGS